MNIQINHRSVNISRNIATLIISALIGLAPLMTSSAEAATSTTEPTINSTSATSPKKISLKEKLRIKRELRKEALRKKLANKKGNSIPVAIPISGFDEYQAVSLTQDLYEPVSKPAKKGIASQASIGTSFFANIELNETIPTTLFQDEIYTLSGKITSSAKVATMFAFLNYQDASQKEQFKNFETEAKNNTFSVPLYFTDEGSYSLGIVPGTNGKSKIQEISVSSIGVKNEELSTVVNNADLRIAYNPTLDKSTINWTRSEDGIYQIAFEQGTEKVIYITRQNVSSLPIRYADFKKFKPGNISIKVSVLPRTLTGSWKTIGAITIPITYHGFKIIEKNAVEIRGTVPSITTDLSPITIQGTALVNLENESYITNTQGLTEKVTLQTDRPLTSSLTIAKGATFSLSYVPKTSGRYIIEINDEDGSAAVNIPVYVSIGVPLTPLIPDYMDLNATMKIAKKPIDLARDREYILSLINDIRTGMGKQKVTINPQLNTLAQKHAEDMMTRNFFGHINPDGASPEDRRKKEGIATGVGENLAYSPSLLSSIQGLLRSPVHRANILTDAWVDVGIGITQGSNNGEIQLVQEFAPAVLTDEGLSKIEFDILSTINKTRNAAQISSLDEDATLKNLAKKWSDHLAKTDEFGVTTKDGQSISRLVEDSNLQSAVQIFVFSTNNVNNIASRILEPSSTLEAKWNKIGLGVSVTPLGEIKITTLLSK